MESLSAVVLDMKMPTNPSSSSSPSKSSSPSSPNHSSTNALMTSSLSSSSSSSPSHSSRKKTLTMKEMLLLNAVVCGVEICACAGFTYIPPLLLKAGFAEERMGFILGAGPLLGFLLVPVIGRASDRCYSQYGRRRPFILGLAIFLVVSLYLIPFGEYFVSLAVGVSSASKRMGVWGMAVGVVLLDFTTQACLTPCEALLNDAAKDTDQSEKIFTVYSLMISLGGVIGYLLTAIDWTSNTMGEYFGGQEASIFSLLIVVFTMMLSATLFVAHEAPLVRSNATNSSDEENSVSDVVHSMLDAESSKNNHAAASSSSSLPSSSSSSSVLRTFESSNLDNGKNINGVSGEENDALKQLSLSLSPSRKLGLFRSSSTISSSSGSGTAMRKVKRILNSCMKRLPFEGRFLTNACGWVFWLGKHLVPKELRQLFLIPAVLKILALTDFCFWTAIMCFNIYYTDYVGQVVYGGNPNAPETSPDGRAYDEGVRIASWGLLLHCICSAMFSFFIERLTGTYGYKNTLVMGMTSFVLAMMGMVLVRHVIFVNLMAALTGFAYSTITTIPFMLVSKYHANKKVYFGDLPPSTLVDSERGIASDMAVLDWSYFLSQVALTLAMGGIVHVTGTVVSYMVSAGVMGILAAYLVGNVVENEAEALRLIRGYTNR